MMIDLTGAVCFSYPKKEKLLSKVIARVTKSTYSHTFVGAPEYLGQPMVIEASFGGVDVTTWRHYDKKYTLSIFMPRDDLIPPDEILKAVTSAADKNLGMPYGFAMLVKMGLSYILGLVGIEYTPPRSRDLVCSQFVLRYLRLIPGVAHDFLGLDERTVSPAQLYNMLLKHPLFTHVQVD